MREFCRGLDGGDGDQLRLDRRDAMGLDSLFVHVGGVEIGHFALLSAGCRAGFRCGLDDGSDALVHDVRQRGEARDAGAVSRHVGAGYVGAVGVPVPVVSRGDGAVHVGRVDAVDVSLRVGIGGGESDGGVG